MNICPNCNSETSNDKFCSNLCQQSYQQNINFQKFLNGEYVGKHVQYSTGRWTRLLLIEQFGYKCNCCEISEWNGKPIILEVNHIDGKAYNNILENLEFLCPNCHSQTNTFKAKNPMSDRSYRRTGMKSNTRSKHK